MDNIDNYSNNSYSSKSSKAYVIKTDMNNELSQTAMNIVTAAFNSLNNLDSICLCIRDEFERICGGYWNCFIIDEKTCSSRFRYKPKHCVWLDCCGKRIIIFKGIDY